MSDFLDRLGDELVRAGADGFDISAQSDAEHPRRRRAMPRSRITAAVAACVAMLIAGAAVAATTLAPSSTPPEPGAPRAIAPDASIMAAFGILRRAPTAGDAIPRRSLISFSGASGANPALARRASGFTGSQGWVVPGRKQVCIVAESLSAHLGGGACTSDGDAIAGELLIEAMSAGADGKELVAGLVPDGISEVRIEASDGDSTAPVHENMYIAEIAGSLSAVTFDGAKGTVRVGPDAAPPAVRRRLSEESPSERAKGIFRDPRRNRQPSE